MELIDTIRQIAKTYNEKKDSITTEEASKMALVLPLIQALGYNVFDTSEVFPEYVADIAGRKGEKIDYAIMGEGEPIIIIECKWSGAELTDDNKSQLIRYFVTLPAVKIAVLTNGLVYQFYTDIDHENQMDAKPYFQFDIRAITSHEAKELAKYAKTDFKLDNIINAATELKYIGEIKRYIGDQFANPDDEFAKCVLAGIGFVGLKRSTVIDAFKLYAKSAMGQFLNDKLNERLVSAIKEDVAITPTPEESLARDEAESDDGIITTQEEIDAYNIVKAILCKHVPVNDIAFRDAKSYSSVLYKDNNRFPICRFYFNNLKNLQLALLDETRKETKIKLTTLDELYAHADALIESVMRYSQG
ncbi:hypothetical protein FACS1894216_04920 [Synergistales bacterium]|nr:hypothetical protein FACS1894216_04920 [Synergistales bacterium]